MSPGVPRHTVVWLPLAASRALPQWLLILPAGPALQSSTGPLAPLGGAASRHRSPNPLGDQEAEAAEQGSCLAGRAPCLLWGWARSPGCLPPRASCHMDSGLAWPGCLMDVSFGVDSHDLTMEATGQERGWGRLARAEGLPAPGQSPRGGQEGQKCHTVLGLAF